MLGLSFEKLLVVAMIAAFIVGPDRLPHYASRLAALVKTLRGRTDTAMAKVKHDVGDDFDVADWKRLDPRQYDPRRIIREALADLDVPTPDARHPEVVRAGPADVSIPLQGKADRLH